MKNQKNTLGIKISLFAPCGMNCGICLGYLREKNKCQGCRGIDKYKPKYCRKCTLSNCIVLKENNWKFCSEKCDKFPCARLKNLDKRYRTRYHMSMLENLDYIKKHGIRNLLKNEQERWNCKNCGSVLCVHRDICLVCGQRYRSI